MFCLSCLDVCEIEGKCVGVRVCVCVCVFVCIYIYVCESECVCVFCKLHVFIFNFRNRAIGLMSRVFANGPGDQGSIPGRVIPKTQKKWYLIPPCLALNIIRYGSRLKWSNPGKGVGVVAIQK